MTTTRQTKSHGIATATTQANAEILARFTVSQLAELIRYLNGQRARNLLTFGEWVKAVAPVEAELAWRAA